MALFRGRHQPARQDAVRAQPAFTWDSYVRLFGGGTSVTSTSVQSIDVALTNSVVWRCAMKNAATLCSFPVHTKSGKATVDDPPIVANPATTRRSWRTLPVMRHCKAYGRSPRRCRCTCVAARMGSLAPTGWRHVARRGTLR